MLVPSQTFTLTVPVPLFGGGETQRKHHMTLLRVGTS